MGSASSKAARTAGNAARKYPTRSPGAANPAASQHQGRPAQQSADARIEAEYGNPTAKGPRASSTRDAAIELDARDPHFASRLQSIGPVQPNPTFSPSSTSAPPASSSSGPTSQFPSQPQGSRFPAPSSNPTLAILSARDRIERAVEEDKVSYGKPGFQGRRFVDVSILRKALVMRDEQGIAPAEIEKTLGLRKDFIKGLGSRGLVEVA